LIQALLSVENGVPLKPVVTGMMIVENFHYFGNSIKQSLQFSCNFVVINAF
jgi:hypothetical protein